MNKKLIFGILFAFILLGSLSFASADLNEGVVLHARFDNNLSDSSNSSFVGSFCAFDNDSNVKDDMMFAFGNKNTLKVAVEELLKEIKKEKGEFINW